MSPEPTAQRRPRPVIPIIILSGFAILLMSWLAFMAHFVQELAHKRALQEADANPPRTRAIEP